MKEYSCFIDFMELKGEGKLTFTDDALQCISLFDQYAIAYTDIVSISDENYRLTVHTIHGTLVASKLGLELSPVYIQLYEKYNETVLKSLFVDEPPVLKTHGEFRYSDSGGSASGAADIRLFPRCLCILPPNEKGRRIPLCFVRNLEKGDFVHKLTLDTGETYEIIRLGHDTQSFDDKLSVCLHTLRKNAMDAVLALDPSLDTIQSARIAKLMPEGVPAPLGVLSAISSHFTNVLEEKIKASRAVETYAYFKEICNPKELMVGMKSYLAGEDQKDVLWIVAPKTTPDGGVAAMEMALSEDASAATYLYRFEGSWEPFSRKVAHAVEAVSFRREVIYLSDEALQKKENALYRMAVERTAVLQFLRKSLVGRVIHSSLDAWKRELNKRFQ